MSKMKEMDIDRINNEEGIVVEKQLGTWYVIDTCERFGKKFFLLESEQHGDEADCLIVNKDYKLVLSNVCNGFDDLDDYIDTGFSSIDADNAESYYITEQKKMCAVCGTTVDTNVILKWKRHSDEKVFHICAYCAEQDLVNAESVKELTTQCYTTIVGEEPKFFGRRLYSSLGGSKNDNK
jgi:hypothetical protein